ncbi:MAG: hypothetical protein KGD57_10050 [Candidatus Lokiarchaeota archaeon]|nr:hypothetical protein [Candidatus Lokiarchaeota archaeon]
MELNDFKNELPNIFEKVKKDVKKIYKRHRAGLSLGLAEIGMNRYGFVGGMHFYPGTEIIMNKTPLRMILEQQPYNISWAYAYHILLHEYIHSLGVIDEQKCQLLTKDLTEKIFKENNHPAVIFAKSGIGTYFHNLELIYQPPGLKPEGIYIEYIKGFDKYSYSYYS